MVKRHSHKSRVDTIANFVQRCSSLVFGSEVSLGAIILHVFAQNSGVQFAALYSHHPRPTWVQELKSFFEELVSEEESDGDQVTIVKHT